MTIRNATPTDIDGLVPLLHADAITRQSTDHSLWSVAVDAEDRIASALEAAMTTKSPPIRQQWLLAEDEGALLGVAHTILLPVPPIYAGEFGAPGLIMEDCALAEDAPTGIMRSLLEAAETELTKAGARILLASSVVGGVWEEEYRRQRYAPLTAYYTSAALRAPGSIAAIRFARGPDVAEIVRLSGEHRQILLSLSDFWKPHALADVRFAAWMEKSLTLPDRDMFVSDVDEQITGYAISQPATALHFPTPHAIGGVGVIDDYYHEAFSDPAQLHEGTEVASELLCAAESALQARDNEAALVVCPAAWKSKATFLAQAGYHQAITWHIKR